MLLYQFRSGSGDQQHRTAWKSNARLFHLPILDHLPSPLTAGLLNRENAETVASRVKAANWADGVPGPYTGAELIVYGT